MTNDILLTSKGLNNLLDAGYLGNTRVPTKIRIGIGTTTPTEGDTDMTTKVPISGTESVDDCDTADWTDGTDTDSTLNSSLYKEGSYSLSVAKDDTNGTTFNVYKTTTSVDFTSKDFWIWVYILDTDDLVSSGTAITIRFGSDGSNYYYYDVDISSLSDGWNAISFNTSTATGTTGSPVIAACDYTYVVFNVDLAADTVAADRIMIDDIKVASSGDYEQTFDSGYPALTSTANKVEIETTLGTTSANGYPISEMGHLDTNSTLDSHAVFTAENKTNTDIFILKEVIKVINTTTT